MLPIELEGAVALVTGGSRGIGRAVALQLNAAGAVVYTCARSEEDLQETRAAASDPERLRVAAADVAEREELVHLLERIENEEGKIDILVNNAGILGPRDHIENVELSTWREVMRVNLDGVFLASKLSIPLMREAGAGFMLHVSSSVGRAGRGTWGPYAVSKHGVEGLSDTLADELADDNIVSVSINPGGTATDMRAEAYPDEDPETLPTADEVAATFVRLITNLTLEESGGKFNSRELLE
jgi:NAD(P)-dependent dehydrogenase (short-subunit alcohol dehydrogenase family)